MASLSREIQNCLPRNAPTPHLSILSYGNSVCSLPLSLAVTNGITKLFSFPAGTKMFQFPACALSVSSIAGLSQIKVFWDQNLRAIPPDLSQLATPFIAIQAKLSV